MSSHRESPGKVFVMVRADHLLSGRIRPLMFRTEDGPVCRIDRIVDEREASSLKAGGQGRRYICEAGGQVYRLFHDDCCWFLEL